jgi:hypothetical protein
MIECSSNLNNLDSSNLDFNSRPHSRDKHRILPDLSSAGITLSGNHALAFASNQFNGVNHQNYRGGEVLQLQSGKV